MVKEEKQLGAEKQEKGQKEKKERHQLPNAKARRTKDIKYS